MDFKEWNDIQKIKQILMKNNFIEFPYRCLFNELQNRNNIYLKGAEPKLSKFARIIAIDQVDSADLDPNNVIELYEKENERRYHINYSNRISEYISGFGNLLLLSADKKKITFVDFASAGHSKTRLLTKELATQDMIFLKRLEKYYFRKLFDENDDKLQEEIITELSEDKEKILIDNLQEVLNFHDKNEFHLRVYEWAKTFRFRIDGNHLVFKLDSFERFLQELKEKFKEWDVLGEIDKKKI